MKQNVWILNHHATGSFFRKGGRHYWLSKYMRIYGYNPVVFTCNTKHGIKERYLETDRKWIERYDEEIQVPYILVNSSLYESNGIDRVNNMILFYLNVKKAAVAYEK